MIVGHRFCKKPNEALPSGHVNAIEGAFGISRSDLMKKQQKKRRDEP